MLHAAYCCPHGAQVLSAVTATSSYDGENTAKHFEEFMV